MVASRRWQLPPPTKELAMRKFIVFIFLITLTLPLILHSKTVEAHASLERSDPPAYASLRSAPSRVRLWFAEPVEPKLTSIKLYDSSGQRVDKGDLRIEENGLSASVGLKEKANGVITVEWSNVSKVDGHGISGSFVFGIGTNSIPKQENTSQQPNTSFKFVFASTIVRFLNFLFMALTLGGLIFLLGVVNHVSNLNSRKRLSVPVDRIVRLSIFALLLVSLMIWPLEVWASGEGNLYGMGNILDTRLGLIWLIRLILVVLGASILTLVPNKEYSSWIAVFTNLGVLLTTSLISHSASSISSLINDYLHLTAMAIWVGGLLSFILLLSRAVKLTEDGQAVYQILPAFSKIAITCVAVLAATGIYSAFIHVRYLNALTGTIYGLLVLSKAVLLVPALMIAAGNLYMRSKRLQQAIKRLPWFPINTRQLLLSTRVEALIIIVILMTTGVLTTFSPPVSGQRPNAAFYAEAKADSATIALSVDPAFAGVTNSIDVELSNGGLPVSNASEVLVRFSNPAEGISQSEAKARNIGNGHYTLYGPYFGIAGDWQVQIVAHIPGKADANSTFLVPIDPIRVITQDGITVSLETEPRWVYLGETNRFRITVRNSRSGAPVANAQIKMAFLMPAHGHFLDVFTSRQSPGVFITGDVEMPMAGEWIAEIQVSIPGRHVNTYQIKLLVHTRQQ